VTKAYTPRAGSYVAKAVDVLRAHAGKMVASGALAALIDCPTCNLPAVLAHGIANRWIVKQRTQSGNWYGIGDLAPVMPLTDAERDAAASLMRQLPPSSVFDLASPPRVVPLPERPVRLKTRDIGPVRFGEWNDGALTIEKSGAAVALTPAEVADLKRLLLEPAESTA